MVDGKEMQMMAVVKVFHISPVEGATPSDPWTIERTHVANVHVNQEGDVEWITEVILEQAYCLTQNIRGSWSRGPNFEDGEINMDFNSNIQVIAPLEVYEGKTYGHRSSMVGDEFELNGKIYRCDTIGFEEKTV